MYFERKSYLQELISAEGNGMIKIVTGIRRCGKSFLLFEIFRKYLLERGVPEIRQTEPNHTMENVIYNELRKLGYTVDVGLIETVRRDKDGKNFRSNLEIDFVVNRIDERVYIQSAYMMPDREKVEQEQASLLRVPDGFKKVIITGDRFHSHYNDDGILIKGIFDFLLQGL